MLKMFVQAVCLVFGVRGNTRLEISSLITEAGEVSASDEPEYDLEESTANSTNEGVSGT